MYDKNFYTAIKAYDSMNEASKVTQNKAGGRFVLSTIGGAYIVMKNWNISIVREKSRATVFKSEEEALGAIKGLFRIIEHTEPEKL